MGRPASPLQTMVPLGTQAAWLKRMLDLHGASSSSSRLLHQPGIGVCQALPVVTRFFWPPEIPRIIAEPTGMSAQTCKHSVVNMPGCTLQLPCCRGRVDFQAVF